MALLRSECSRAQIEAFMDAYFAAVDIATDAAFHFDTLVKLATNATDRSFYKSKSLEAQRDSEVLKNHRRGFMAYTGRINPPSTEEVKALQTMSDQLAKSQASIANASALLQLFADGITAIGKIVT